MTAPTPPGWYPDPGQVAELRWWDGNAWTANVSPATPVVPAPAQPVAALAAGAIPPQGQPSGYQPYLPSGTARPQGTIWQSNPYSMRALIVTAIYLLIAVTTPLGLLGIVPIFASIRAMQAGEKLAPAAIGAAALAFIVGMLKLTHHF